MKASVFTKRFLSVLALFMAMVMVLSACNGGGETSSTDSAVSGDAATDVSGADGENTTDASSTGSTASNSTAANNNGSTTSNGGSTNNGGTTTTSGSTVFSKDYLKTIPDSVKKAGVHVLMWRNYTKTEKKLVDEFQQKTGMKVRTTVTTEQEYSTKLIALVTGNDAPDVVMLSSGAFPSMVVKALQPLDSKQFRLDDSCWYKAYMDAYKVNGKYYSVAMRGSWSCEDGCYVTYYLPSVLRNCGITTMPYELYKQGKWNWDTELDMLRKIKQSNKGTTPLSLQSNFIYMLTTGADFISFDGTKFTNNINTLNASSTLVKAWSYVSSLQDEGLTTSWNASLVEQGKVGLFTAISYGLYNEGDWFTHMKGGTANMEAVPVAGAKGSTAYVPVNPKTWGTAKKCKNPEGAAYFLRYWLDISNFNISSTFYNKQFEEVYNIITSTSAKKGIKLGEGVADYVNTGKYGALCNQLGTATAANVFNVLQTNKGLLDAGIKRANADISRLK